MFVSEGSGSPALGLWQRTQRAGLCITAAQSGHQQSGEWCFWKSASTFSLCLKKTKRTSVCNWCDNLFLYEWTWLAWNYMTTSYVVFTWNVSFEVLGVREPKSRPNFRLLCRWKNFILPFPHSLLLPKGERLQLSPLQPDNESVGIST